VEQLENKVAFIGHIRQFIFNKIAYTELAYQGNVGITTVINYIFNFLTFKKFL